MPLPLLLSEKGPLLTYLQGLWPSNPALVEKIHATIRTLLETPDGAMLLDLLEKSTSLSLTPILADTRALEARNAQGFIALDLRRIMSDEIDKLVQQRTDAGSPGRTARRSP
ncbi:MAG: hypothetical protein DI533_00395 [Cereibacter sphaeroides]|uniref:Uncharacterized protein n=1 Tax=Cereibacter sphaeroides TaxID=1063 RepID=A0A2W5SEE3_CERSP|nr:MAG: hypothetical protein DI533_00395 [Cereibacter sphaeroides]